MSGISIHVVDISRGVVAEGMRVEFLAATDAAQFTVISDGAIDSAGLLANACLPRELAVGGYRAVFHVGDYYRNCRIVSGPNPFLDVVNYDFRIATPEQHVHLPFKCTPWGYSCFRGGA